MNLRLPLSDQSAAVNLRCLRHFRRRYSWLLPSPCRQRPGTLFCSPANHRGAFLNRLGEQSLCRRHRHQGGHFAPSTNFPKTATLLGSRPKPTETSPIPRRSSESRSADVEAAVRKHGDSASQTRASPNLGAWIFLHPTWLHHVDFFCRRKLCDHSIRLYNFFQVYLSWLRQI